MLSVDSEVLDLDLSRRFHLTAGYRGLFRAVGYAEDMNWDVSIQAVFKAVGLAEAMQCAHREVTQAVSPGRRWRGAS